METSNLPAIRALRPAWNKGRIVGQKLPLKPKHVWAIRVRLELAENHRDLALFGTVRGKVEMHEAVWNRLVRSEKTVRNQWWLNAKSAFGQVIIFPLTVPLNGLRICSATRA
ncbi:MAG: hypothetical protein ACI875_001670 [Planctomycetota bacterium]|jgi:hypothetical protein